MNLDYIAGFFDGEGSAISYINSKYLTFRIDIANTNRDVLEKIREYLGFGRVHKSRDTSAGNAVFHFYAGAHEDVLRFIELVFSRCFIKKEKLKEMRKMILEKNWGKRNWINPSEKENIRKMYWGEEKSLKEIGKVYDCSGNTIGYFMKKYGIPRRSFREAKIVDWKKRKK